MRCSQLQYAIEFRRDVSRGWSKIFLQPHHDLETTCWNHLSRWGAWPKISIARRRVVMADQWYSYNPRLVEMVGRCFPFNPMTWQGWPTIDFCYYPQTCWNDWTMMCHIVPLQSGWVTNDYFILPLQSEWETNDPIGNNIS